MFSREYFKYLIRSKRYLLLFIFITTLLNVFGTTYRQAALIIEAVAVTVLSFVMPVIVFYHAHDRKAVDAYFSLPVSRKAMLWSGLLFSILVIYVPLAMAIVSYILRRSLGFGVLIGALLEALLACTAMTVFNLGIYLLANNLIDGIIMMGAYTFMPIAIFAIINNFFYSYVAGINYIDLKVIRFICPIYMAYDMLIKMIGEAKIAYDCIAVLLLISGAFCILLHRSYVMRKAERAESRSTGFFCYPFVILTYVVLCLFMISTIYGVDETQYCDLFEFVRKDFILYLLLFAAYVTAYFVYRRKLYFSYRLPMFYIIMMVLSLCFAGVCRSSRGFGLSDLYRRAEGNDYVAISAWSDENNPEYGRYIFEQTGKEASYVDVNLRINEDYGTHEFFKGPMSEETSLIIDGLRKKAIEEYYDQNDSFNGPITNMSISNKKQDLYYHYDLKGPLSIDVIRELAKDSAVDVFFMTEDREYRMLADGSLVLTQEFYADEY